MREYLNNEQSRWIDTDPELMKIELVLQGGKQQTQRVKYFESFGNFVTIVYRYKGQTFGGLPKTHDESETRVDGEDPRTFIFHKNSGLRSNAPAVPAKVYVGTSYFVSFESAVEYYRRQHETCEDVRRKLDEGDIHIGVPELKAGEKLKVIDGFLRYGIETGE